MNEIVNNLKFATLMALAALMFAAPGCGGDDETQPIFPTLPAAEERW